MSIAKRSGRFEASLVRRLVAIPGRFEPIKGKGSMTIIWLLCLSRFLLSSAEAWERLRDVVTSTHSSHAASDGKRAQQGAVAIAVAETLTNPEHRGSQSAHGLI
jgi:hypothetical protein